MNTEQILALIQIVLPLLEQFIGELSAQHPNHAADMQAHVEAIRDLHAELAEPKA